MPFTDGEKRLWHNEKQVRERPEPKVFNTEHIATCVHCHNPFGLGEGMITDEVALCYICAD